MFNIDTFIHTMMVHTKSVGTHHQHRLVALHMAKVFIIDFCLDSFSYAFIITL